MKKYINSRFGAHATRRNYNKHEHVENRYDSLLDVQIKKFQHLLDTHLGKIFENSLNLNLYETKGKNLSIGESQLLASLKYKGYEIGEPRRTTDDAILYNKNFEVPVYLNLEFLDMRYGIQIPEQKVYLFDLPKMTGDGSFIINGSYKIIVPQIIRSNGIYFNRNINYEAQKSTYSATILPTSGLWIIFDYIIKRKDNQNEIKSLFLRIDQNKKINFTYFLKSLGLSNDILFLFFQKAEWLKKSIASENTNFIFDSKYTNIIIDIMKNYDQDNEVTATEYRETEIVNIINNDLYLYIPNNSLLKVIAMSNQGKIEHDINNELNSFYSLNIVGSKQMKTNADMDLSSFLSEKKLKNYDLKNQLSQIDGLPPSFINTVITKNWKSFNNLNFDLVDDIENLPIKLGKVLSRLLLSIRQKINWMANFLICFHNYSDDVVKFINDEFIDNFVSKSVFESKRKNIVNFDYNKSLKMFYSILKPGDPFPKSGSKKFIENIFFDPKKYNISEAGLVSLKNKLNLIHRVSSKTLAVNIVDAEGKVLIKKGTYISHDIINLIEKYQKQGLLKKSTILVNGIEIFWDELSICRDSEYSEVIKLIGVCQDAKQTSLNLTYIVATINYLINLENDIGYVDDIDSLENRRVKCIDELFGDIIKNGLTSLIKNIYDTYFREFKGNVIPKTDKLLNKMISTKNLSIAIREFVNISQLSQFLDQTNPLSNISNKRRITALGPGGLNKERAGLDVRDVHATHFGRICPIETPEGPNIGLISNLACFSKVNDSGFLLTPYYRVHKSTIDYSKIIYLSVADERDKYISEYTNDINSDGKILKPTSFCRLNGLPIVTDTNEVDYICTTGNQIISIATGLIPFLENDDSNRTLMGANMQRQAVPLLIPEAPLIGTGREHLAAKDSNLAVISKCNGVVTKVNGAYIIIQEKNTNKLIQHDLAFCKRTNQNTAFSQKPIVKMGEKVITGEIIADGPSMKNGELALGKNILVAFSTFYGYNYEDAIIVSERLIKDDTLTSIHIETMQFEVLRTKLGPEEVTYDVPFVSPEAKTKLGEDGIVAVGSIIEGGDILVGKITPKSVIRTQPELELLNQIFGQKAKNIKNSSLVTPTSLKGVVIDVKVLDSKNSNEELPDNIIKIIKISIATKRKIQAGDKLAGRHGNKGVISIVLPEEDMPFLADGKRVDIILNPLGVPSRMNIGQILELQLGYALSKMGEKVVCPSFEGLSFDQIKDISKEAGLPEDGKNWLYDGFTGEQFSERISLGYMYILKLNHMVEDKIHMRCTGNYSLITQQPLGGKSQKGGQRFGEMEVWALEGYGAAYLLQEMLTIKSDDIYGRIKSYENIIRNKPVEKPQSPASIKVLFNEMRAIGLKIDVLTVRDIENIKNDEAAINITNSNNKQEKGDL